MSLTVEDGTGLADADSYVSVADATAYIAAFYLTTDPQAALWAVANAGSSSNGETSLRRATRDIDATYTFAGYPNTVTQALEFPRDGDDFIPTEVQSATVEMALLILGGFDPTGPVDKSGAVESERTKLGGLETETSYFYATDTRSAQTNKVDTLLSQYVQADTFGDQIELVRG